MPLIKKETFVCIDCETTGLDPIKDRIIEVAVTVFTFSEEIRTYETLIDPECPISEESIAIHHISPSMLHGKPKIEEVICDILDAIGKHTIIGHGVGFDIDLIALAAQRSNVPCTIKNRPYMDTLRLARHYGDSPNNSLENLAKHFNVPSLGAHRALNDVLMNISVFKHLVRRFDTTEQIFKVLDHPIKMKFMPLGKHKGRPFSEIPLQYLQWAAHMNFDQDLLYSIRLELKNRKKGGSFSQAANPFTTL